MSKLPYDDTSPASILDYAKRLSGKSLSEVVDVTFVRENLNHKGDLGAMVERYYFGQNPPNDHSPDFSKAGVELKVTGVTRRKTGEYKAKERLVLSMINYMTLVDESWDESSLMRKCRLMLLLFYLYEKEVPVVNRRFVFDPLLWSFPENDLKIISSDWMRIREKIREGRAHELSEGDTFYLAACRKGSGGPNEKPRPQPFSEIPAKSRAFSLKPSYIDSMLTGYATESVIIEKLGDAERGLETMTTEKFKPYIKMKADEIGEKFGRHKSGPNDKNYIRDLTMLMLGTKKKVVPEFVKADIEMKTIRLKPNGMPSEPMSFPNFIPLEIINEEWEDSDFYRRINRKFLFVVFEYDDSGSLRFSKTLFWNMPYQDREEARRVWEKTKYQIASHQADVLPKSTESRVAFVKTKGKNNQDLHLTPQGVMMTKKGFWLKDSYIADQVR